MTRVISARNLAKRFGDKRVFEGARGELELPPRQTIGYIGHEPLVYRELTARENLTLFARLYGIPRGNTRVGDVLAAFGLGDVADARVATFSRGMQQRLGLCRVLLHDPELLLFDEPFNALDVEAAALLDRTLAEELAGRTIVVATHDPERVEGLATQRLAFA
jgi:heme exporter protein A